LLADDDLCAPDAVKTVHRWILDQSPDLIVGRTRRFVRPDLSDLSIPVPEHRPFRIAHNAASAAEATGLRVDLGAFVFRSGLVTLDMYDRYSGTNHEIFGALWDGVSLVTNPRVIVMPDVLVYARQAQKAHDDNAWLTWLGMLQIAELLPSEVRDVALTASSKELSFRPVLRAIAEGNRPRAADVPPSVWSHARPVPRLVFRLATRCPSPVASLALRARERFGILSRARGARVAR
jgi:hypothetical protein